MFGNLFTRKSTEPVCITVRLNDRLMPVDRGEIYEDPLDAFLIQHRLGNVVGGGTQLNDAKEIEYCDLELELNAVYNQTLDTVKNYLESLGAPRGSKLMLPNGQELPLGKLEGLAIYLNGTDLPDHVYQDCDANVVYREFQRILGNAGAIHSSFRGAHETVFNLYGTSAVEMQRLLAGFLGTYPLCQQARLVQIA